MKTRTMVIVSLLAVLAIGVSYVAAQSTTAAECPLAAKAKAAACSSSTACAATASLACADKAATAATCPFKAAGIELTAAQQTKIHAIVAKARQDVLAALNVDQRTKFAPVSISFAMAKPASVPSAFAAKVAAKPSACCASEGKLTAAGFAAKLAAQVTTPGKKSCGADCTKPCCAK